MTGFDRALGRVAGAGGRKGQFATDPSTRVACVGGGEWQQFWNAVRPEMTWQTTESLNDAVELGQPSHWRRQRTLWRC